MNRVLLGLRALGPDVRRYRPGEPESHADQMGWNSQFSATDPTRTLPALLAATAAGLAKDNARYRDRIRIRMAAGFGLVGRGSLGVIGNLVVEINRLNDSAPIRRAILDHPESDLVVLISDILHQLLAHSGSASNAFRPLDRVEVALKEYRAPAWLWIGTG